jgi:hypothetical protein
VFGRNGVTEFMVRGVVLVKREQWPSEIGRNLQCELVKGVNTREECHWSHAWQRFKRSKGVKLNGILECNFLSKNAHRTVTRPANVEMSSSFKMSTWHRLTAPRMVLSSEPTPLWDEDTEVRRRGVGSYLQ